MRTVETLQDIVRGLAQRGDRPAIIAMRRHRVETWSGAGLSDRAERLAAGFLEAGLKPGMHAILFASSRPEWIATCFGLILAGAVPVPIDTQMTDRDLAVVLEDSQAKWIFTTTGLLRRLDDIEASHDRIRVLLDGEPTDPRDWRRYLAERPRELPKASAEDRAVLFYTSGTSGPPKGVPLTHRNVASNLKSLIDVKLVDARDRVLLPLPLHHVYPFSIGIFIPLNSGSAIVLPFSLTGPQILRAMQEGKATALVGVPRLLHALDAAIHARIGQGGRVASAVFGAALRLSVAARRSMGWRLGRILFRPLHKRFAPQLRLVASGGSAIDGALAWRLEGLGWAVATGYGLTETSPLLALTVTDDRRPESTGRPLKGVDLRIADPEEEATHGEVQAKGPNVFAGYHNLPEKTREVFTEDGYFRTGDLGYLDKDGFLYLVGRASSLIVLPGGENVRPENVEEALERGEHIREAGVLEYSDRLVALVVPEHDAVHSEESHRSLVEAIREEVHQQNRGLPTHHRIADYVIVHDPLPRTRLGKLRRYLLKDRYEEVIRQGGREVKETGPVPIDRMAAEHRQLLEDPVVRKVWDLLCVRFADVRLSPESNVQLDLGIDSMEWLNLTLEIRQKTGADLEPEAIAKVETVADLLQQSAEADQDAAPPEDMVELLAKPEELLSVGERHWVEPCSAPTRAFGGLLMMVNRHAMMRHYHRIRVEGVERIPRQGPVLFAPNHRCLLDPSAISAAMPRDVLARTYWAGFTGIMFDNAFMRMISRAVRVVPVAGVGGTVTSLAFGVAILQRGNNLVWFPEGSRSPDGRLHRLQLGVGLLLLAQPVPVVPVWVQDSDGVLPSQVRTFQRRTMEVTFGDPVDPEQLRSEGEGENAEQRIVKGLTRHLEALGGYHVADD